MAALYGTIKGNRGEASRLGTKASGISARLETWQGAIEVRLEHDGHFTIYLADKGSTGRIVASGNVGDDGNRRIDYVDTPTSAYINAELA